MSVVNLLFEIGRIVILFLSEKNMSKDIIKYILYGDNENIKININNKVFKNQIAITESGMNIRNEKEEKEKESISNNSNEKNNTIRTNNINTDNKDEFGKKKQNKINNLFKTNYLYNLKSFFCFKDRKTKFINLCHEAIINEICIERILKRLMDLEKIYHIIEGNENLIYINKEVNEIIQYINQINKNQINEDDKNDKNDKIDDQKIK